MKEENQNYQGYPIVQVKILSVYSNRLMVRLPDRKRGIIYDREWSWDDSKNKEIPNFIEGQSLQAVQLPPKETSTQIHLSIRHVKDPWENVDDYKEKQVVIGEVVHIRKKAAYVQLEPGIQAAIWPVEMPLLPDQLPEDILVIGDKVRGEIIKIDKEKRRILLSIVSPLRQTNMPLDQQFKSLKKLYKKRLSKFKQEVLEKSVNQNPQKIKQYYLTEPLSKLQNILLIDDDSKDGASIIRVMREEFNSNIEWKKSGAEGLQFLKENWNEIDLVLIDLNLDHGEHGIDIGRKIIQTYDSLPIVFVSKNIFAEAEIIQLERLIKRPIPFAEKPIEAQTTESFVRIIHNLQEGKILLHLGLPETQNERFIRNLERSITSNQNLNEKLDSILYNLLLRTLVDHALIVSLNSEEETVTLRAGQPKEKRDVYYRSMDNLYFSPVRQVAEEGETFYIGQIKAEKELITIQNFFPNLSFQSCYCIPITVPLQSLKFALLLLDSRPDMSGNTIMQARTAAAFAALAIEREQLLETVQRQQNLALQGTIMGTFLHELNNKLQPLFGFVEDSPNQTDDPKALWEYFSDISSDILQIKQLLRAYSRLAKAELQEVNLNQIVDKVKLQLAPLGKQSGIKLEVDVEQPLPLIQAIPIHIEQVLTNVVLNAIQLIEDQNLLWQEINNRHPKSPEKHLHQQKLVVISTCVSSDKDACCIMVTDTGPGVPYTLRDRIFQPHVTMRKDGQGLGLFISRNLVEAMHGRLEWISSVRFCSSAFAIIFPILKTKSK